MQTSLSPSIFIIMGLLLSVQVLSSCHPVTSSAETEEKHFLHYVFPRGLLGASS